ncbi:MAG: hypothetical protein BZY82_10295 [SAR202 cluster bacterium Io17-Chloro-G3]|nr:MAG: hypothetical protein BZY82_10295 [SAR202 cluster bacterium Io17-Chloro-G3]
MHNSYLNYRIILLLNLIFLTCGGEVENLTSTPVPTAITATVPVPVSVETPTPMQVPTATIVPTQIPSPTTQPRPTKTPTTKTVSLGAIRDNTIYEDPKGEVSNGLGFHLFSGQTKKGKQRRTLLAFDVAKALPSSAVISSAELTLNVSRTSSDAFEFALHRIVQDWGEGDSDAARNEGDGGKAEVGDATWLYRTYQSVLWASPGGDFVKIPSATATIDDLDTYRWLSTSKMVSDVQSWIEDPDTNFGWAIIESGNSNHSTKRFDSRENPSATYRPTLIIGYTSSD